MKITDLLEGVGNPVQFYPDLVHITGSHQAAIFLGQLLFWTGKQRNPDGWIYKTQEDWELETELSEKEQRAARKHLTERGLTEERFKQIPRRLEYRINRDRINQAWDDWVPAMRIKRSLIELLKEQSILKARGVQDEVLDRQIDLLRKGFSDCRKKKANPENIENSISAQWEFMQQPDGQLCSDPMGGSTTAQAAELSIYTEITSEITSENPPIPPQGEEEQPTANGEYGSKEPTSPPLDRKAEVPTQSNNHIPDTLGKNSGKNKGASSACDNNTIDTQSSAYKMEQNLRARTNFALPKYRTDMGWNGIKQEFLNWLQSSYLPAIHKDKREITLTDAKRWVANKEKNGFQEEVVERYEQMLAKQAIANNPQQPTANPPLTQSEQAYIVILKELPYVQDGISVGVDSHNEHWRLTTNLNDFNGWLRDVMAKIPLSVLPVKLKLWYPECYRLARQKFPQLEFPAPLTQERAAS